MSLNQYAKTLMKNFRQCLFLIPPALKHMLLKTIPNIPTELLSDLNLMLMQTTLMIHMIHTRLPMATCHPLIRPEVFLGDASFDSIEIYKSLFEDLNFRKAFIPLKVKLTMDDVDYSFDENGIPCCPHDSTLPMKREGSRTHLKNGIPSMKLVCPKMTVSALPAVKLQTKRHSTPIYF